MSNVSSFNQKLVLLLLLPLLLLDSVFLVYSVRSVTRTFKFPNTSNAAAFKVPRLFFSFPFNLTFSWQNI